MNNLKIESVPLNEILELRTKILRPGQWPEVENYNEDLHASTRHFLLSRKEEKIAIGTFIHLRPPKSLIEKEGFSEDLDFVRLRGMGVKNDQRRKGYGRALLQKAIDTFQNDFPDTLLWFHARQSAFDFYQSMGFHTHGDFFDVPNIGPHKIMWKRIKETS